MATPWDFFVQPVANILGSFMPGASRSAELADREHTEMREDTAVQRLVEDYRKAGLNPATISASPQASTSSANSNARQNSISNQLSLLGAILDIGNLSLKNRKVTNDLIGDVLGFFKKK